MNNNETLKALYKTLKTTQKRLYEIENAGKEQIAVIGMACRFPGGASNIEKYRALLESGGDAICEVPQDRWDGQMYYNPDPAVPGKVTTNRAGFLQEPIDGFDCSFFHLSPKEVQSMDPQQRMLLEVCWEAFENAGIDIATLKGSKTGVFCGIANSDYAVAHLRSGDPDKIDAYSVTGTALSAAVGRISYLFGFEGPNMALDTACSSSLVAVHLACQSLRSGESDIAVAAGINLILTPEGHIGFSKLRALSPDGRCKSFDDSADGYGRGEGCGLIVLKRLSEATKDGDPVCAVIRGTAVNQDGRTNGFTAPSGLSQEKVLGKALENSDLRPEDIGYIETHGTGTPLGDPIEMEAIGNVYSPGHDVSEKPVPSPPDPRHGSLYVGSVKANIGHLEAAAGIAGLIKAVLMLDDGSIFPQIHFSTPNRHIPWSTLPVKIPLELMPWPRGAAPRGVAVSSFGFSGTNANVILQEGPLADPGICGSERSHHILNISANNLEGLRDLALLYHGYLSDTNIRNNKDIDAGRTGVRRSQDEIEDICYTASVGRGHFPHRLSVVGRTKEELRDVLGKTHENALCGDGPKDILVARDKRIIFLFTGQGSQYHKMGWDLYQTQPVFRSVMDRCNELLGPHLDCSLNDLLYEGDTSSLHETRYTQPVIFAVEYALAKLLESWGIKPSLVIGHSIGEYVAATIAGIFELKDVLGLVAARGRLVQSLPMNGSMAAIMAGEQRVKEAIDACRGNVSIAAMNAPRNTVISGEKEAIDGIIAQLRKDGIASHILKVSHAFHSCLLDPILEEFGTLASGIRYSTPNLPIMANTTGRLGGAEMATSNYWTIHLREPVRFYDSMRAIGDSSTDYGSEYLLAIEVGGTSTITNLGRQCIPDQEGLWLTTLGSMDNPGPGRIEGQSDWEPMLKCLAGLYTAGCDIDWEEFDRPYQRKKVVLPNYPFQRKRCWIELPGPREKQPVLAVPLAVPCNLTTNRGYKNMISQNDNFTNIDSIYAGTVYDQLNRMGRFYILRAFKETGVLRGSEEQYQVQVLKEKMGVIPEYERLFDVLLIILKNAGFISLSDTMVTALGLVDEWDIQEITRAADNLQHKIAMDYPEMAATVNSLAKCMDKYAAVLTGGMSYAEALFPNGSMELVENLYTNNRIQDFFNRLVGQKVGECVTQIATEDSTQKTLTAPFPTEIKILEIGAGTGSTTGHVLREISGTGNFAYCYTDIASVFTQHGERKFGASYPFMTFKTLDIEEDVESQGFDLTIYDVIIASNVLHATARIDRTLGQVRKLLKPGGVLIMNEVTTFQEIVSVIFGLTSGWWLFQDPECRIANCPSLSFAGWKTGLEEAGFIHLEHSGLPGDAEDHPMQCVIIAKSGLNSAQPGRRERIASEVMGLMYQSSEIEITGHDGDTNLFELGFASLMIARLKDLIKRMYGLDVQMSWFYSRLDTFNKTVDYIDKESEADKVQESVSDIDGRIPFSDSSAPDSQSCPEEVTAAPPALRIEEDVVKGAHSPADGIISQQIELMSRQLAVMSEQLHVLQGAGKVARQELQTGKREPLTVLNIEAGRTGVQRSRQELQASQASLIQNQTTDAGAGARHEITTDGGGKTTAGGRGSLPPGAGVKKRDEYVAYRGVTARDKLELNTRQKEHLQRLIGRYTNLTAGSKELTRKYRPVFANTRNIAGFRPEWKEMIYQIIVDRAEGSHFTDIDGRDYLDISMGFGVYLLGHNPPCVQAALQREIQRGTPIGPMSDRAGKVATLIHELTGVERVAFFNTGTEAVMAAVRIARTVTGRKKIALFSSAYHGHFDGILAVKDFDGPVGSAAPMSPGTPSGLVQDIYVIDYGTEESLQFIEAHGHELAAVLVEPVQSRRPDFQPAAFLKRLREITTASGSALIFDEVILGFRIHQGGAQAWFDIKADIVTYGKVVGGSMPIGVVAGKSHYLDAVDGGMWNYGDGSFPEKENTFIAGTFNHHPLAMASAHAVLIHLKESGPSLQANLNRRTGELAERLNSYFAEEGLPIRMIHFGSLFRIPVKGDQELLYYHLLSRGIYIWEGRNCFLSTAHTDEDIGFFVKSVQESIGEMRAGGLFGGCPPTSSRTKAVDRSPLTVHRLLPAACCLPMSSAQKRLYVVSRMEGGELAYHINGALFIDGALDRDKIEHCFQTIISRHESLRTGFEIIDDALVQRICENVEFTVSHSDLSHENKAASDIAGRIKNDPLFSQKYSKEPDSQLLIDREGDFQPPDIDAIVKDFIKPFDLAKPPLLRVGLVRLSADRHFLIIDAHHIVIDGISLIILAQEFMSIYGGEPLPPVMLNYRDYVEWEQKLIVSESLKKQEAYWLNRLSGKLPVLRLPLDYQRPPRQSFEGGVIRLIFERSKTLALKALAKKTGSTPYMVLFTAFNILLHRLSGQKDIIIATSSSGRDHLGFEGIFGMCTNTLVMRNKTEGNEPFILFLDKVKKSCLQAFDNQDYPFELLIKNLNLQRDVSRNPLFDVFFVYEEADNRVVKIKDLTFTPYEYEKQACAFDLLLEVIEEAGQLYLNMEYCAGLFRKETVERFLRYYMSILEQITENPSALLSDINLSAQRDGATSQKISGSSGMMTGLPATNCLYYPHRQNRDGLFPLSHHQERLWFVDRFESGYLYESSPVYYNMPLVIHLTGTIDEAALEKSVNRIIERHEILRTKIITSDGQAFQTVTPQSLLKLSVEELPERKEPLTVGRSPFTVNCQRSCGGWSTVLNQDSGSVLYTLTLKDIRHPFLMDKEPLIRSTLFNFGKEEHLLVITMHHIIADPWSMQIVMREMVELYNSITTGVLPHLPEIGIQFADFAEWEKETSYDLLAYKLLDLRLKLNGKIQALELPTDRPRPAIHTYHDGMSFFGLSQELTGQLKNLAIQEGVTTYSLLLAAFQTLLHRYSGQENIVTGVPVARRDRKEIVDVIGPFANLLVIPSDFSDRPTFRDLLRRVERNVTDIFEYRDAPFDRLVLALDPKKDMSRTALFDVMFQLRDSLVPMPAMKGLQTRVMETNLGWGKYDLNLCMEYGPEGMSGIMVYNKDLFDDSTIERMNKHYQVLLDSIVKYPSLPVTELRLLTAEEEHQQIFEWNDTRAAYPANMTIHQLFEEQVENTPDSTAVVIGKEKMTYRELNRKANQLAHHLRKKGVVPDQLVCICMERSMDMIIAMLAILKAGGAYTPLDPSYPRARLQFMLEDTGAPLVVTHERIKEMLPVESASSPLTQCSASLVLVDADMYSISRESEDNPVNYNSPEHLAYIIYTSGSTGKPKGVLIEHRNVVRLMTNDKFQFDFTKNDIWTMSHSYCFDFSVWEMYGALLYGGKLVIVPKEIARDSEKFLALLKAENVTVLNQTPRSFYNLAGMEVSEDRGQTTETGNCHPSSGLSLRYVIFGGEALKPAMLKGFNEKYPEVKLINMYGITETTVHVTYKEITESEIRANVSNVGKPIPTLTAYIMDKGLKLLPIGVPGELLVGGDGVARGYLNRAELTREKFIANPYKDGERLYRSGDLAKMLPNGEIEYLGRIDQQVKIRGYRIELGEIENVLMMHPQIDQAAVIDREDAVGDRFLCAYLVVKNKTTVDRSPFTVHGQLPTLSWRLVNGLESSFSEEALRRYLGDKLPEYMIPSQFFRIENMPLTSNGKIDTKALLLVEGAELKHDTEFAGPQTAHEELLVSLWKAVLGREEIGVLDNYFTLGGDSIKAIQILSRLNQHHLKLEVRHIFETPTIRALAKKLETISRIPQQGIITGRVPLTAIQTWFFMEHGNDKELLNHYTQAVLLHSKNRVDDRALGLSLMKLQEHHDSLRMIFRFEGESVVQEIASLEYPLGFTVVDLKEREDAERELDRICAEVPASLQMTMGPMMKTVLFRLDDGDRILIVIHHLAVDGVSWRILIEDLEVCYGQAIVGRTLTLPQKTDSYRLWAEKIAQYSTSRKLLEEIPFWRQIEEIGALAIPPDYEAATVEGTSNPIVEGATSPIVEGASSSITVEGTRSPMTLLCRLNRYEDMGTVFVKLSHDETTDLITKANSAYHTEVNDLLLAAFGRAMKRCYGAKRGFIDVEGHGRELLFNDIAIGRTVGWFTSMYPALIDIPESEEPGSQIKQIKEGLRRIPNKGVGYGILKYLVPAAERSQMQSNSRARILFNYLGSFDAGEESRFFIDDKGAGNTISGRFERESEIVIEGAIIGNRLKLGLSYNTKVHCKETVDMFLGAYRDELLVVIGHCVSRETGELTPHDLTYNDLTVQELDNVLAECKISIANLKDIYPLSPLQEGILFHAMLLNGSNVKRLTQSRDLEVKNLTPPPIAYFMQISFGIEGELNLVFFEACWNMLIARHDILRTVFTHKGADRPLQVVARTGTIDFRFEDIIALSDDQQREHLAEFRNNDRKEGFNLMVKAPMRVSIFKKSARSFEVIWSYHHLLIDGWCAGILMSEFFETYGALRQGGAPAMTLAAPYGAYIRWVEHLDHQATIDYWRDYLDGYDHPAVLPKKQGAVDSSTLPSSGFRPESFVLEIGPQTVESLKRFASGNQVTVNTIIQTAWGLVLGRYSGADDVVFGATVSGRPAEVADIENMAGLFINTIPVRIRINPEKTVARLVRDVQADALKSQAHHYGSLADVQAATSLKQELLDHVMVFENYPLADELIGLEQKYSLGFCIKDVKVLEQTNYDLIIVVEPGRKMQVEFRYNAAVFPADMMEQVKDAFEAVISSMAGGADISIGQLRLSLMSKTEQNERDSFIKSAQEISEDF